MSEWTDMKEQVEIVRKWLRGCTTRQPGINHSRSSYGMKHDVENWTGHTKYISQDAFNQAATEEGYESSEVYPMSTSTSKNKRWNIHIKAEKNRIVWDSQC